MSITRRAVVQFLLLVLLLVAWPKAEAQQSAVTQASSNQTEHTLVFMTDFGLLDDSVAICKAVMLRIDPTLRIMDITHDVKPYSIADGARYLSGTSPYYGPGTVFVVVVDPGVGSSRKAIVAKSKLGQYFVVPDNGLLTLIEDRDGIAEAREITNPEWMIGGKLSSTFHGRDIFSPVGAHLARGDDWTQVGPVVPKLVRLNLAAAKMEEAGLSGEIIATDGPFGNLITNTEASEFAKLGYSIGDEVKFTLAGKPYTMPFVRTFSDVAKHAPLLYIDSRGRLAIAVNQGNAQSWLHVTLPSPLLFQKKKAEKATR
ncbi:MAG TPA: SAM-dependent chlorinase/fluorinase [Terriglobales bacterium]|nr:SAM-dependent chlorinase/fluorinase [Terriglobales bacterium]